MIFKIFTLSHFLKSQTPPHYLYVRTLGVKLFIVTPKKMSSETEQFAIESRAKGCLLGQAIGDALGTRYEFQCYLNVQKQVAMDKHGSEVLPILGGGPFHLIPGQVTDDTELAMGLARSLQVAKTYDKNSVALAYYAWYRSGPFDIGNTTRVALGLAGISAPETAYEKISANAAKNNSDSLSNGCLMRISPLGVAGCHWPTDQLQQTAAADCCLTNPNTIAQNAVACYVSAVQRALHTGDPIKAFQAAEACAKEPVIAALLQASKERPIPVKVGDMEVKGDTRNMGYLGVAFQGAFYELLHAKSFAQSLENTILRGGDTDTNGCITGALLGARFGSEQIPDQWKKCVLKVQPKRLKRYPAVEMSDVEVLAVQLLDCKAPQHKREENTVF